MLTRPDGRAAWALDEVTRERVDRAEGALMGVLAGDALGWRVEVGGALLGGHGHVVRHVTHRFTEDVTVEYSHPEEAHLHFVHWRFSGSTEDVLPGETSDDSQLTLAVARARVCSGLGDEARVGAATDWWPVWTETELPLWWLGERGGGRATRDAAASWALERAPWDQDDPASLRAYFHAGGNGVATRVLPHVIAHLGGDGLDALLREVFLDGVTTHGHPRALLGAQVLAHAGHLLARAGEALRHPWSLLDALLDVAPWSPPRALSVWWKAAEDALGRSWHAEWNAVAAELRQLLEQARSLGRGGATPEVVTDELGARGIMGGAGTISVALALHHVARWLPAGGPGAVEAVLYAAHADATDADSVASMVGGLFGLALGRAWQPRAWDAVQDGALARALAFKLATGVVEAPPRPVRELDLVRIRAALTAGRTEVELDGRRTAHVRQPPHHERWPHGEYLRWRLDTSDGQRVYVRI